MKTKKSLLKTNSITVKIMVIGVLVLLMLIPISMIKSMISERNDSKGSVQSEISSKWGGSQELQGPILVVPFKNKSVVTTSTVNSYAYFLPEDFNVKGDLMPQKRSRGMYEVLCFQSTMKINGKFNFPDYEKLNLSKEQMDWDKAFFQIGISNLQGIKNQVVFNVDGKPQTVVAGIKNNELFSSGLTINYPIDPNCVKNYEFDFDLALNGTEGLYFTPIGKQTNIHLKSEWKTVSFVGDFLPNQRAVDQGGFDSQWSIFDYNRNYAQAWTGINPELNKSKLGVDLLLPIDHYQKTMRSVKYAIMFIALTFLVFFMVELLSKRRIHPVQYLLVSFALVLFYSLLLAFSEHIGFDWSYLLSAVAIIGLITAYSKSIFKNKKETIFMGIFLTALYVFLYVVIQLEDMALLLGTIGLFIALAIVMYTSRKINWYKEDDIESTN